MLSAEELLAGSGMTYEVAIPPAVLATDPDAGLPANSDFQKVRIKPLTVGDLQLITRAAKENDSLIAALMVQKGLAEPALTLAQVSAMHVGLMRFLLEQVNAISGITASEQAIAEQAEAPLAKAAFILSREFGWTPAQVSDLTMGQIMLHLHMLKGQTP